MSWLRAHWWLALLVLPLPVGLWFVGSWLWKRLASSGLMSGQNGGCCCGGGDLGGDFSVPTTPPDRSQCRDPSCDQGSPAIQ